MPTPWQSMHGGCSQKRALAATWPHPHLQMYETCLLAQRVAVSIVLGSQPEMPASRRAALLQEAAAASSLLLASNPRCAAYLLKQGTAVLMTGQPREAVGAFEAALGVCRTHRGESRLPNGEMPPERLVLHQGAAPLI